MFFTNNPSEKSAIDFVVADRKVTESVTSMVIDEIGILKIKGRAETDHNTILLNMKMEQIERYVQQKTVCWRLNAPESEWKKLRWEMKNLKNESERIFSQSNIEFEKKYSKFLKMIEVAMRKTIGKTTIKTRRQHFSDEVSELRRRKRELKKQISKVTGNDRADKVDQYKGLVEELRNKVIEEKTESLNKKLKLMIKDKSRIIYWKAMKKLNRDNVNECLTVKNEAGERQYHPEAIKNEMATHYEKLYAKTKTRSHPHHEVVKSEIEMFKQDRNYENEWYNQVPTEQEVIEVIRGKKNGKATTDLKNEIMKRTEPEFVKILMPLIIEIFLKEMTPSIWNVGSITSLYKGKGDKESLQNHRGITVSSSIGGIIEEIIDRRMQKIVKFTQGQAGGIKGASTCDHLFLLRGMMACAIARKENLFITFYDVAKAYDRADVNNMMHIIWKAGVRGKLWRILLNLSTNLRATIKTRYGPSREIIRENGGRQGSSLTGRLFSKQMDTLSEQCEEQNEENFVINENFNIGCLEWVDDVLSCTTGIVKQKIMLKKIDEFAMKNKLEWGESKCQVMQVGKKVTVPDYWELGEKKIANTNNYKYLGDYITNDNKNKMNLQDRANKIQITVRQINTTASSDVMRGIETSVILDLYEKSILPRYFNNAESWTLSKTEEKEIDVTLIRAVK